MSDQKDNVFSLDALLPPQMAKKAEAVGIKKANLDFVSTLLLAILAGVIAGGISLGFGFAGWPVSRLWLYLLGSAMLMLVGVQLVISWVVMRVLEGLQQREMLVVADLNGRPAHQPASLQPVEESAT